MEEAMKALAENATRQTQLMERLLSGQAAPVVKGNYFTGYIHKHTLPGTTPTAVELHGRNGLFSTPGLEREVVTAHIRPEGIGSILPKLASTDENPRFASLTGFSDVTGSEPTEACADAPVGYIKGCNLTAKFGLIRRDTNVVELDKVMLRVNRGDFTDLQLVGAVLGETGLVPSNVTQDQILNIVTKAEMVTAGVNAERKLAKDLWQGTVAAGTFPGLDVQIATGQVDADQNVACPALDSYVDSFGYSIIGTSGAPDIVRRLQLMEYDLTYRARKMGLDPVKWVIAMTAGLWRDLTEIWPYAHSLQSVALNMLAGNSRLLLDGKEAVTDRDAMRANRMISINGNSYQVVIDDGIFEHNSTNNANLAAGNFASSIYMIPLTITGSFPVTYIQYLDYRAWGQDLSLISAMGGPQPIWTDNGMFSWTITWNKWCFFLSLKSEPRVVLRTPQLAGRLDHVGYASPHLRSFDPQSVYWADGGVSIRNAGTNYAVWNS